jgi:iron complex transport system substrate-binding protein
MLAPDIERILALQPDLVVLSIEGNRRETYDALVRLDVPCLVTQPRTLDGVLASLRLLGSVTSRESAAEALADSLETLRSNWTVRKADSLTSPSVLMVLSLEPLIVVGEGTFLDELIVLAGGRNAGRAGAQAYPALSREEVLARNPDVLLLPDDLHVPDASLTVRNPEWRRVAAVRRGAVHRVNADLFLRPGPRVFSALPVLTRLLGSLEDQR